MQEFTLEKVKGLMAEKGLKQIDVAEGLGVSLTTANSKLNGKIDFTLKELKELARLLNTDFIITR